MCEKCDALHKSAALLLVCKNFENFDGLQLGLAVVLDKPIILVTQNGVVIPDKLMRVVDHVVLVPTNATPADIVKAAKEAMVASLAKEAMVDMGLIGTQFRGSEPSLN